MRELTFRGFLTKYVRELSLEGTNDLAKLVREACSENARLREPLLLYALFSGKEYLLLKASYHTVLYSSYFITLSQYDQSSMEAELQRPDCQLSPEYRKVWRSYESLKRHKDADDHTKELIRRKLLRLQAASGITNYRIYTALGLNPGNLNAWLKHGSAEKVSLDTARAALRYVESI